MSPAYSPNMSMAAVARREREEVCALMLELGPAAATLDEGWKVLDLAAHLVARERDLWASPGIMWGGLFGKALEKAMERRRRQGLERLVELVRDGPPPLWKMAPAGAHLSEYYIHHEDVRRANDLGPRTDRRDLDEALARLLPASAPFLTRRLETGVDLVWNGGVLYRHGPEPRVVLSGPPGEILFYLSGRRAAARVDLAGDEDAVEKLRTAAFSL